jgi:hypothetical protein
VPVYVDPPPLINTEDPRLRDVVRSYRRAVDLGEELERELLRAKLEGDLTSAERLSERLRRMEAFCEVARREIGRRAKE